MRGDTWQWLLNFYGKRFSERPPFEVGSIVIHDNAGILPPDGKHVRRAGTIRYRKYCRIAGTDRYGWHYHVEGFEPAPEPELVRTIGWFYNVPHKLLILAG